MFTRKGDNEDHYFAKLVVADIEWLGHIHVILKSNTESAIVVLEIRVGRILRKSENPPAYDSQSQGGTEAAIIVGRCVFQDPEAMPGGETRPLRACQPCAHPVAATPHMHAAQRTRERLRWRDAVGASVA